MKYLLALLLLGCSAAPSVPDQRTDSIVDAGSDADAGPDASACGYIPFPIMGGQPVAPNSVGYPDNMCWTVSSPVSTTFFVLDGQPWCEAAPCLILTSPDQKFWVLSSDDLRDARFSSIEMPCWANYCPPYP